MLISNTAEKAQWYIVVVYAPVQAWLKSIESIPCDFHEFGTKGLKATSGSLVPWTFDSLAALQGKVLYTPTPSSKKNETRTSPIRTLQKIKKLNNVPLAVLH